MRTLGQIALHTNSTKGALLHVMRDPRVDSIKASKTVSNTSIKIFVSATRPPCESVWARGQGRASLPFLSHIMTAAATDGDHFSSLCRFGKNVPFWGGRSLIIDVHESFH